MSALIRIGRLREGNLAKFDGGKWTSADPRLASGLNELFRKSPIPEGHPNPDQYAVDVAMKAMPDLEVLYQGPSEAIDPNQLPKWLRFMTGQ
jgi:hypothetical protein